jgi:hypothetical protein
MVAIGVDDPDERERLAVEGDLRASGLAVEVAEGAIARTESGCRLSVVG